MALASTDLLIVSRAEESYKVPASEVKSFILGSSGGGTPEFVGNAATATKLQTPRLINGTAFDGLILSLTSGVILSPSMRYQLWIW